LELFCFLMLKNISLFMIVLDNITQRIENINNFFTYSLYTNVCRSLFEKHKLLFSFLLSVRILMEEGTINMDEWRFLLAGGSTIPRDIANPASDWLSDRAWKEIVIMSNLQTFAEFADDFQNHLDGFKNIFDSIQPHRFKILKLFFFNFLSVQLYLIFKLNSTFNMRT